jgi:NMD protein affecting ribosome stability and mRNA decay
MRRTRSKTHPAAARVRESASNKPRKPDPYAPTAKLAEPAVCGKCGLQYRAGRWLRRRGAAQARRVTCPACRRIADRYPAGIVRLAGPHVRAHREEIEHLIRHVEQREQRNHPLKRVMELRATRSGLEVTTTDAKLARAIGVAVRRAHHGQLDYDWSAVENVMRVDWKR